MRELPVIARDAIAVGKDAIVVGRDAIAVRKDESFTVVHGGKRLRW